MMKNKLMKILLLACILLMLFSNCKVYASDTYQPWMDEDWMEQYQSGFNDPTLNPNTWTPTMQDQSELTTRAGKLLGIINIIGIVISVLVLVGLGLKYMLGSVEEKADFKKVVFPYIIGCLLIMCTTTLPNIILKITSAILK